MRRQSKSSNNLLKVASMLFLAVVVMLVSVAGLGYLYFQSQLQPINPSSQDAIEFTIETGESPTKVAERLESQNLIKNAFVFKVYLKIENLGTKIQAGDFLVRQSMSVSELANALTKASSKQTAVTLLEGWRVEEASEEIESKLSALDIPFNSAVFQALPEIKEGYVFPDTYFFALDTNEQAIAKTIEANFNQKLAPLQADIKNSKYSLNQILTMASIVEREARTDRAIVAGILWKRLENDWPLQADATLQYAKGYNRLTKEWWTEPLAADKEIASPYNTYANTGLPPAPIANPSLSSIEASLNPVETEYWFYITDNQGNMHYSVDYDGHLANVNRYLR